MNTTAYAIRNHEGHFFRGCKLDKYRRGRFIQHLNEAMLYKKEHTAAGVVTTMVKADASLQLSVVSVELQLSNVSNKN